MVFSLLRVVLCKQLVQHFHPPHPGSLLRHLSFGSILSLICAHIPVLLESHSVFLAWSLGMDSPRPVDSQIIFDHLADLLSGVGTGSFFGLIRVHPDLLFTTGELPGG